MNDLISRQAAIDLINGLPKWIDTENGVCLDYADVIAVLSEYLPPVQPETTTVTIGRTKGGITMWYKCDACDEPVDQNDNYCRNCGRKLKHE